MKFLKDTLPFSALGMAFLIIGLLLGDPKQISFGVVWLIIACAKFILAPGKEKVNHPN